MKARIVKVDDKFGIQTSVLGEWVPYLEDILKESDYYLFPTYEQAHEELKGYFDNSAIMGLTENRLNVCPGVVTLK